MAHIQAPFDGFIKKVYNQCGDRVFHGDILAELDTKELKLKEAEAKSDLEKFSLSENKARYDGNLTDMIIAQTRLKKAQLELKRIQYLLTQAIVRVPYDGIVVKGEKQNLLSAPVRVGNIMYIISNNKDFYLQLYIDEQDIHEISINDKGKAAFLCKPEDKFPIIVSEINSSSIIKKEKNVFEVRAEIEIDNQDWFRVEMSGIGKIYVGKRQIIWILSHRISEFLNYY